MVLIGIIGGSGLDNPDILKDVKEVEIETIYGKPSSKIKLGKINNINVALLARHGLTHSIPPSQVNYRANIQALKQLNCTHILATTAVGSLKKEIQRGDLVILDQFIDFTRHRKVSFHEDFNNGIKHTPMAEPFNENLRNLLIETGKSLNYKIHEKGTVITIEGPRFSTKAESKMFSNFADVINMSIAPECILANELNIPYAAIAMSTDYDCLFDDIPSVTWEDILEVFHKNSEKVKELLINVIPKIN
ncbi:S-methyl-5'-thioadenosine phosphorylase [Candidatus Woesearchaeota archaeon]|nr:S-methyl-5'-thioadenosine phosphorylase [Candidatus Woesearchaeota archaeon]